MAFRNSVVKPALEATHNSLPWLAGVVAVWGTWWVYRFIISPKIYHDRPSELPYWIPVIGHVRGMSTNMDGLFSYARSYFGNTRAVFSITVMGQEFYIVTSPEDVSTVYKNTNTKIFDYNIQVKDILGIFGINRQTIDMLFEDRFNGKSWMDLSHENLKLQMHPGTKLDKLQGTLLSTLDQSLNWDSVSKNLELPGSTKNEKVVSLYRWSSEVLVDAGTIAFYGNALYRIAPTLLSDFLIFDDEAWKLYSKYPYIAARKMYQYKEICEKAFQRYVDLPAEERDDASWIVKTLEQDTRGLGVTDAYQISPNLFVLHRLLNTNAYKQCFWCLAYLLHNEALLQEVRAEIKPAFQADGKMDLEILLEKCPVINSLYEENLRFCNAPIGARQVVTPFVLGGKLLRPGKTLLMPYRQLHFNEEVFGNTAGKFDAKRFLNDKSLLKSTSYRPFGGGSTLCPGRFIAKREVLMFVALVLFRFDISLAEKKDGRVPKFPKQDVSIPSGGIMGPLPGEDVILRLRPVKA